MIQWKLILAALVVLGTLSSAYGDTIVAQRANQLNRFIPLRKVTVGPDDQYNATVDPSGGAIVYTHKADLVAHIEIQDLQSGENRLLLPKDADSEEPIYSPDGRLAFTYFKFDARGDICYATPPPPPVRPGHPLSTSDVHCLKREANSQRSQRASAFWISENELGFLEQDIGAQNTRIVGHNLKTNAERILAEGRVWSPDMRSGGHYLVYNEWVNSQRAEVGGSVRQVVLLNLSTGKRSMMQLQLPGISGFPQMSVDEKMIYFSHYMADTNNDQLIDGNDNAVVFRATVANVENGAPFFPEQLTSVESSCSFPRPAANSVFVTCAFEGSLDIYEVPLTGIVPTNWGADLLENAIKTSRSYQDRILLLNTLKVRNHVNTAIIDQRLLSDHLLSGDTAASRYYLEDLKATAKGRDLAFLQLLEIYISGLELKVQQPTEDASDEYVRALDRLLDKSSASSLQSEKAMVELVRGSIASFKGNWDDAAKSMNKVAIKSLARPLEIYLYFELRNSIDSRDPARNLKDLVALYRDMMTAPALDEQSQIFYGFSLLNRLQTLVSDIPTRIALIKPLDQNLPPSLDRLLQSEIDVLQIITGKDDAEKLKAYQALDKLMSASRDDTFGRRALYVRAMLNLAPAAEFKYMNFVVNAWLKYTAKTDTELAYARELFGEISYGEAYESLGKKNLVYADNYFYQALTLTDDLEAHYGYIQAIVAEGKRASLTEKYKYLSSHDFLSDNMKFVDAVLGLIDAQASADRDPTATSHLDKAIAELQDMSQDRDSAVRYLLLGYCYMEKMFRQANGYDVNAELYQSANHYLTLAYDLGRDNDRIKASALMDLGLLHSRVQDFGQASKYLALRDKLGFNDDHDRAAFSWFYAAALEHSHQDSRAAEMLSDLPAPAMNAALAERRAFDLSTSGNFKAAAGAYAALFKAGQIQGDLNLATVSLSYGFVLFKLHRDREAASMLQTALDHASRATSGKQSRDQLVSFDPLRVKLIAYGLLAQMGAPAARANALEKRYELLPSAKKIIDDVRPLQIQNRLQLAGELAGSNAADLARASVAMQGALKQAQEYGESGQYLGTPVYRTAVDFLVFAIANPSGPGALNDPKDQKRIEAVVEKCEAAYESQKITQPLLDYQAVKLRLLLNAWTARHTQKDPQLATTLETPPAKRVEAALPGPWAELQKLASVLSKH